jgi:polar amino acid transport system substrate-binding protein
MNRHDSRIKWTLYQGVVAGLVLLCATRLPAKELVIAFTLDTPPYVKDDAKSGISIDLVRAALKPKGYTFTVRQMPYGELADAVETKGVDAAATVTESDNGTFYSKNYVAFHNVAITKKDAGIQLDTIADLKGKTIVAWQNAYEDLGPEFKSLFGPKVKAPYREKYREIADQKQQVEMFWKGDAEVIVIDRAVMRWFTKELAGQVDTSAPLEYHKIFRPQTRFRVDFKSKQVRDDFDAGLKELRSSGMYRKIYEKNFK